VLLAGGSLVRVIGVPDCVSVIHYILYAGKSFRRRVLLKHILIDKSKAPHTQFFGKAYVARFIAVLPARTYCLRRYGEFNIAATHVSHEAKSWPILLRFPPPLVAR
jgi:hypothetical protein